MRSLSPNHSYLCSNYGRFACYNSAVLQWRCICVVLHLLRRVYHLIYLKAGSVWGDFLTMTGESGEEEEVHEPEAPEVSENV